MRWPVDNPKMRITSKFGYRIDPVTKDPKSKQFHNGIDLGGLPHREKVYAPASGTVRAAYWDEDHGGGKSVSIIHDDELYRTGFAHLDEYVVSKGQHVAEGDLIGYVGNTGKHTTATHLHFSMYKKVNNKWEKTDPLTVLVEKPDPNAEILPKQV